MKRRADFKTSFGTGGDGGEGDGDWGEGREMVKNQIRAQQVLAPRHALSPAISISILIFMNMRALIFKPPDLQSSMHSDRTQ